MSTITPRIFKGLWLREPRQQFAYALSDLGAAISRLGHRIDDEVPGDYGHGFRDGQGIAAVYAAVSRPTTREDMRRFLSSVGVEPTDELLDGL